MLFYFSSSIEKRRRRVPAAAIRHTLYPLKPPDAKDRLMSDPRHSGLDAQRAGTGESAPAGDPLAVIERQHGLQEGLCDLLEKIADGLPHEVDRDEIAAAVTCLSDELPLLLRNENDALFPLLAARTQPEDTVGPVFDKLTHEHATDLSFAGDVAEALREIERGAPIGNAEMLGFMLRSFFESYRRHLFWERTVILPLARKRLTPGDLVELGHRVDAHRKDHARQIRRRAEASSAGPAQPSRGPDGAGS